MPHLPIKRIAAAVATAAALGVPSAAQAQNLDVPLEFDYAVLDTPATPDANVVTPEGEPIRATANVDPSTGDFTVQPENFDFPKYTFSSPVQGSIDVILNAPARGKVDFTTGQVTFDADFEAQVDVTGLGACNLDTGVLTMSTEKDEPLPGVRFPPGPTGVVTGPGAMTVDWESLPPGTGPGCSIINAFVGGPGGFWISKGIAPPSEGGEYDGATLKVAAKPSKKKVKAGSAVPLKVSVSNSGDEAAEGVTVCMTPAKGLKPKKRTCKAYGDIAAGKKRAKTFVVKTPKSATTQTYKVVFKATATGVKAGKATATITATGKKKGGKKK
jgi:hypothetical protein